MTMPSGRSGNLRSGERNPCCPISPVRCPLVQAAPGHLASARRTLERLIAAGALGPKPSADTVVVFRSEHQIRAPTILAEQAQIRLFALLGGGLDAFRLDSVTKSPTFAFGVPLDLCRDSVQVADMVRPTAYRAAELLINVYRTKYSTFKAPTKLVLLAHLEFEAKPPRLNVVMRLIRPDKLTAAMKKHLERPMATSTGMSLLAEGASAFEVRQLLLSRFTSGCQGASKKPPLSAAELEAVEAELRKRLETLGEGPA